MLQSTTTTEFSNIAVTTVKVSHLEKILHFDTTTRFASNPMCPDGPPTVFPYGEYISVFRQ